MRVHNTSLFIAALLLFGCSESKPDPEAAEAALRAKVERYAESIDAASPEIGEEVWLESEEASFIHPRGEERGWQQIVANFYDKTMGRNFSKRKLTVHDVEVSVLGDTAIVLFNWDFDATRREDGAEIHTTGRESQIYLYQDAEWALVHVHYSGARRTAPMEGF